MVFLFLQTFRYFISIKKMQNEELNKTNIIVITIIYMLCALYIVTSLLNSVFFFIA